MDILCFAGFFCPIFGSNSEPPKERTHQGHTHGHPRSGKRVGRKSWPHRFLILWTRLKGHGWLLLLLLFDRKMVGGRPSNHGGSSCLSFAGIPDDGPSPGRFWEQNPCSEDHGDLQNFDPYFDVILRISSWVQRSSHCFLVVKIVPTKRHSTNEEWISKSFGLEKVQAVVVGINSKRGLNPWIFARFKSGLTFFASTSGSFRTEEVDWSGTRNASNGSLQWNSRSDWAMISLLTDEGQTDPWICSIYGAGEHLQTTNWQMQCAGPINFIRSHAIWPNFPAQFEAIHREERKIGCNFRP